MSATPAQAATRTTTPAFTALGQCLAKQKQLALAFVLDESGSLGDASSQRPGSDPTAQRVAAAQVAVQGLAQLSGRGVTVNVLLAGFSDDFHTYGGWQTLDPASSGSVATQLDGFRTRNTGDDTDFYAAVAGAQQQLAAKVATMTGSPCEVVLLFTDGRFDIASHVAKVYDANAADADAVKVEKGLAALCAANGPMQSLRRSNAETITLALSDASGRAADQPDRGFLSRLATGDCGTPGASHGASFDAANASDLVAQFDAIVSGIRGGVQRLGDCVGSGHAFNVVDAIGSFHLLADMGQTPKEVVITTPANRQVRVSPTGTVETAPTGVVVHASVTSNRFLAIDTSPAPNVDPASAAWTGRWAVNFASSNPSGTCQVFLFGAWKPVVPATTLQPGRTNKVVIDLAGPNGRSAGLARVGAAHHLSLTLTAPSAKPVDVQPKQVGDHYEADYAVPRSWAGRAVTINAVFHVEVGGADVTSSPVSQSLNVSTRAGAVVTVPAGRTRGVVAAGADPSKPADHSALLLLILAALVLVGVLFVLFMVVRSRRRQGTFVDPSRLSSARVAIRVRRDATLTRIDKDGAEFPLVLRSSDFSPCGVRRGRVSSFSLDKLNFKVVTSHSLLRRGYGEVSRQGQYVTASGGAMLGRRFTVGRLPLDLSGTWVYELDADPTGDEAPFVDGHVTVFVKRSAPAAREAQRLVSSFNSFLTDVVLRLASKSPDPKAATSDLTSAGSSSSGRAPT